MRARYAAVVDTLNVYFDGLYFSDVSRLERVLHPRAHYVCAVESELIYYRMEEYFPIVKQRPSPASRCEVRKDKIIALVGSRAECTEAVDRIVALARAL